MDSENIKQNTSAIKTNNRIGYAKLLLQGVMLSLVVWQTYSIFFESDDSKDKGHIAVIQLSGAIQSGSRYGDGLKFADTVDAILKNENAKAILIEANSPGGSPTQAEIMSSVLKVATKNRDVIVSVGEMCASACLFALAGNPDIRLTAHRSSIVGSVGVKMESFGINGLMSRLDVERRTYSIGEHKSFLDPFAPADDSVVAHIENELLLPVFEQFKEILIQGRGDKLTDERVFSGLLWTGEHSIDIGLIDELTSNYDLRKSMEEKYGVDSFVYYNEQKRTLTDMLSSSVVAALNSQASIQFK